MLQGVVLHCIHSTFGPAAGRVEDKVEFRCHLVGYYRLPIAGVSTAILVEEDIDDVVIAPDRIEDITTEIDDLSRRALLLEEV